MSGVPLLMWEVQAVKHLSGVFVSGINKHGEEEAERPYLTDASSQLRMEEMVKAQEDFFGQF